MDDELRRISLSPIYTPMCLAQDVKGLEEYIERQMLEAMAKETHTIAVRQEDWDKGYWPKIICKAQHGSHWGLVSMNSLYRYYAKVQNPWNPPIAKRQKRKHR